MNDNIWKNILYVFSVGFLSLLFYLIVEQQNGQFLALLAAALCIVGTRIADVIKFKLSAGGLEAEMKGVLKEAKATIEQLHLLAAEMSKVSLQEIQASGRYGGGTTLEMKDKMRANLIAVLEKLGLSGKKIEEVTSVENPYIQFDYYGYIFRNLEHGLSQEKKIKLNEFMAKCNDGIGHEPPPQDVEDFLKSIDEFKGAAAEWLEDYKYFLKHHKHRRPEVWAKRWVR